jgi:hypothetical protein
LYGGGADLSPAAISREILTNDLFGLGLTETDHLNGADFAATSEYCYQNDLLMSVVFDKQQSILDVLQYLIQHHDGYIAYKDGKISHKQLSYDPDIDVVEYEEKTSFSDSFTGATIDTTKWTIFGGA